MKNLNSNNIYLLDTNILSHKILEKKVNQVNLCVLQEVVDEWATSKEDIRKISNMGIQIREIRKKHLKKMVEIISKHGDNLNLIRLYTKKGTADIAMLSYLIAEKENYETLFPEEFTLVTRDKELVKVAKGYGVNCVDKI